MSTPMSAAMTTEEQLAASIIWAHQLKSARKAGILHMPAPPPQASPCLGGLPAELYYTGSEFAVPLKPAQPIDETRPLRPSEKDARALVALGRAGMIRFFAGRWSRRLGRVVRPKG